MELNEDDIILLDYLMQCAINSHYFAIATQLKNARDMLRSKCHEKFNEELINGLKKTTT